VKHYIVVKKTDNLASAVDRCIRLKLRVRPVCHLLAACHPRVDVDREDDEDLELMGASERRLERISWIDKGRELYETATFSLCVREAQCSVITQ
jgi:hypothetical protein